VSLQSSVECGTGVLMVFVEMAGVAPTECDELPKEMQTCPEITTFYEAGAVVGKGGIWDPETKIYYYTDIAGMTLPFP
jgi:hypothetical protein